MLPGRFFLLFFGLLLHACFLLAQPILLHETYNCELLGTENGLSQGLVRGIEQDTNGFFWFATGDGMNRYDGYNIRQYQHDATNPYALQEAFCRELIIDRSGWMWVATNKTLHVYDAALDRFMLVDRIPGNPKDQARAENLVEDSEGNLWLVANGQLWVLPLKQVRKQLTLSLPAKVTGLQLQPAHEFFKGLPEKFKGSQFFFNAQGNLVVIQGEELTRFELDFTHHALIATHRVRLPEMNREFAANLRDDLVFLAANSEKTAWYYHGKRAFYQLDPVTFQITDSLACPAETPVTNWLRVSPEGLIYGNTDHQGLVRADFEKREITHIHIAVDDEVRPWMLQDPYWDAAGNLWLGTYGFGVLKYGVLNSRFKRYPSHESSIYIKQLTADGAQHIRVNNDQDQSFDLKLGRFVTQPAPAANQWLNGPPTKPLFVWDKAGYYWVTTDPVLHGKSTASAKGQRHTVLYRYLPGSAELVPWVGQDSTYAFLMEPWTDLRGRVWVQYYNGKRNRGLIQVDSEQPGVLQTLSVPKDQDPENWKCRSMMALPDGRILTVSKSGLTEFDPETGTVRSLLKRDGNTGAFSNLQDLILDPIDPSIVWLGSAGGLLKFQLLTGEWTAFTTQDGLPNNVVYALELDDCKNLWLSTNRGLCLFDREAGVIRTFDVKDGLQNNEFNGGAGLRTESGMLVFGGTSGFNYFQPEDFYGDTLASPVMLTGMRLFNQEVPLQTEADSAEQFALEQSIHLLDELIIRHDQSILTFSFASMDFTQPQRNRFRYRMDGFSDRWIDAGNLNEATFTNLDPGDYTFRVQGCNSFGIWNAEEATIQLTVLPPWWQTWWFRTAVILAVIALAYAFFRYRLRQLLKLQRVRDRIARDLHDEIGSTLSSISLYSAAAESTLKDSDDQTGEMLGRIGENATQVMESMNDIVWAINSDNDDAGELVDRMRTFAVEMLEPLDTQLHFEVSAAVEQAKLEMVYRRNLYLIFKEAINNAAKYAACQNVWVNLELRGKELHLSIRDDGKGFDPQEAFSSDSLGGNGLINMQKRGEELQSKVHVNSVVGKGTTVEVRVDLRKQKII